MIEWNHTHNTCTRSGSVRPPLPSPGGEKTLSVTTAADHTSDKFVPPQLFSSSQMQLYIRLQVRCSIITVYISTAPACPSLLHQQPSASFHHILVHVGSALTICVLPLQSSHTLQPVPIRTQCTNFYHINTSADSPTRLSISIPTPGLCPRV